MFRVYQKFYLFLPPSLSLTTLVLAAIISQVNYYSCFLCGLLWTEEIWLNNISQIISFPACDLSISIHSRSYRALHDLLPAPLSFPFTHHHTHSVPALRVGGFLLFLKQRRHTLGPLYLLFVPSVLNSFLPESTVNSLTPFRSLLKSHLFSEV